MANELNLQRNQLNRAQVLTRSGHRVIQTALGRNIVVVDAPAWEKNDRFTAKSEIELDPARREFVEADDIAHHVHRSIFELTNLHDKVDATLRNDRLSDVGRIEALSEPRKATVAAVARNAAAIAAAHAERQATVRKFYEPPSLSGADVAEALLDDRIVRDYQSQPLAGRMQRLAQADERTVLALKRAGIPFQANEAGLIDQAWRESVERRHATKAGELKLSLANASWALDAIQTAANFASLHSGLSRMEIAEAAAGTGGEGFFGAPASAAA